MKKNIVYTGLVVLLFSGIAEAQEKTTYYGKVRITPHELAQRGDSLYVSMDMNLEGASVECRKTLDIVPMLTDGTRAMDLPAVSVMGRRKYKEYRRGIALMSRKEQVLYEVPYAVERGYKNNNTIEYRYTLPYKPWMSDAWLNAKSDLCGCGGSTRQVAMERLVDNVSIERKIIIEPYHVVPYLAYVSAEAEVVKHREITNEAFLDFAVGKTDIRPDFGSNPAELLKIRRMIDEIEGDKDVTIRSIDITGYASPEGSLAMNKRLSEGRARALQSYLEERYDIDRSLYAVHFGGEDWAGLVKLVEESDMQHKEEVLALIESVELTNGREAKLMALKGGVPYRYMLKEMFPSLRRVICKVDYEVKNFDVAQAREVIKTRPQNLSLNEMYAVANTYEKGSQEFNDVFETAVRMFPEDETANLNAAAAALARKDLVSAERYLGKVKSKIRIPEYDNAMGVLELLKGNYDKAEASLRAAADGGVEAAAKNLEELAKKRENIKQIEEQTK